MDYEYYYNNARNRYYNACSEINSCENTINSLKSQKQQTINNINRLSAEISNHQEALTQVNALLRKENDLLDKCTSITAAVSTGAANFFAMVQSTDTATKNLSDVYGTKNVAKVNSTFVEINNKKTELSNKIQNLQSEKRNAENQLSQIEASIRNTNNDLDYWRSQKSSASMDMDYYRRKMNEEENE